MNDILTLEYLETRTLLAGLDSDNCELETQDVIAPEEHLSDIEDANCSWGDDTEGARGPDTEQGIFDGIKYASARLGVSVLSAGLGIVEGGIVALPSVMLILGGEYFLGKMPDPAKILLGLATYPLSLQVMDELLMQEEPRDPLLRLLSPVKSLVETSDSVINYFEEIPSLEVGSWAKALQPRALKNFYWAAATTVFSGAPGGFDYPHLELPERVDHGACHCEC